MLESCNYVGNDNVLNQCDIYYYYLPCEETKEEEGIKGCMVHD